MVDVERVIEADRKTRPQPNHVELSAALGELFEDRATQQTLGVLNALGTGNPKLAMTRRPLMAQVIRKLVSDLSVLYAVPASRRLVDRATRELLPDDSLAHLAMAEAFELCEYDQAWRAVDAARNLYRQCVLVFAENHERRAVDLLVFEPHSVYRQSSPVNGASLESDSVLLLELAHGYSPAECLYQAWVRDGAWRSWMVDGTGSLVGEQPYGESGAPPFEGLPAMLVFDGYNRRPWLPIPESRIAFAASVNSQLNDLEFLVTQEAHTRGLMKSDDPGTSISRSNPGDIHKLRTDDSLELLSTSPKIAESISVLEQTMKAWAMGESLPVDAFSRGAQILTGDALVAAERDLERRRFEQIQLAPNYERTGFDKFRMLWNAFAPGWGRDALLYDADLSVSIGRAWQPKNTSELQNVLMKDLAIGAISILDYYAERYGMTREQAIRHHERVQADRQRWPVVQTAELIAEAVASTSTSTTQQSPGALTDDAGPRAPGINATPSGGLNPDLASGNEKASILGAAQRALGT